MSLCRHCGFGTAKARGLCDACFKYEARRGMPRPADIIARHIDRKIWQPKT